MIVSWATVEAVPMAKSRWADCVDRVAAGETARRYPGMLPTSFCRPVCRFAMIRFGRCSLGMMSQPQYCMSSKKAFSVLFMHVFLGAEFAGARLLVDADAPQIEGLVALNVVLGVFDQRHKQILENPGQQLRGQNRLLNSPFDVQSIA